MRDLLGVYCVLEMIRGWVRCVCTILRRHPLGDSTTCAQSPTREGACDRELLAQNDDGFICLRARF